MLSLDFHWESIPPAESAAVSRALQAAFGVSGFEAITRLPGGAASDLVYRIAVGVSVYVLRLIRRVPDPRRQFTCMTAAAEAGLAPRVHYTSVEDRIAITDFIETLPLSAAEALVLLPAALRTLHSLPPFTEAPNRINTTCTFLMNEGPTLDGVIRNFRDANVLPEPYTKELLALRGRLAAAYRPEASDMAPSHNDLFKPDNILYDGSRVWLVDWEAAFQNDRYADLAVVANQVVSSDEEERTYLEAYFGQPPDPYQLARLFLMRQVAHLFYALVYLPRGAGGKPVDADEGAPEFGDVPRRVWAGELSLSDNHVKAIYGRVHWRQLLSNVRQARFEAALRTVAAER